MNQDIYNDAVTWSFFAVAVAVALYFDRIVKTERQDSDTGLFWTVQLWWFCVFSAVSLFLFHILGDTEIGGSILKQVLRSIVKIPFVVYLQDIKHFLSEDAYLLTSLAYPISLWLVTVVWSRKRHVKQENLHSIAGTIGKTLSRKWVLGVFMSPLFLVWGMAWDLESIRKTNNGDGYPLDVWFTLLLIMASLSALAFSSRKDKVEEKPEEEPEKLDEAHWPHLMRHEGIQLDTLVSWKADKDASVPDADIVIKNLKRRATVLGMQDIYPELYQMLARLIGPMHNQQRLSQLLVAPDECGQAEATVLGADALFQRFHVVTLVVVHELKSELIDQLKKYAINKAQVEIVKGKQIPSSQQSIWLIEAKNLSDHFMGALAEREVNNCKRIGMVVWWDLHEYTGVLAANLWAISHRLHRLLTVYGRHDLRTIVCIRRAHSEGAQLEQFVKALLPFSFSGESVSIIDRRFSRDMSLHILEGHQQMFSNGKNESILDSQKHLALMAVQASVLTKWETHFGDQIQDITEVDKIGFLERVDASWGSKPLVQCLRSHAERTAAEADIIRLRSKDVLSISERVESLGRSSVRPQHHVAILRPENAYAYYLLDSIRDTGKMPAALRLVAPVLSERIVRRHLTAALRESANTESGIKQDFLDEDAIISTTLEAINKDSKLSIREVRYLNKNGGLVIEKEYSSSTSKESRDQYPLDTVGMNLINVIEAAGGSENAGIRMTLDPERATIKAYPGKIFVLDGQRYKILEQKGMGRVIHWSAWERSRKIYCVAEGQNLHTWRKYYPYFNDFKSESNFVSLQKADKWPINRLVVNLRYEETVTGYIYCKSPYLGVDKQNDSYETVEYTDIIESRPFSTRGLVLRLMDECDEEAKSGLVSIAEAMRHVLAVHLGIDNDVLEVRALLKEDIQDILTSGIIIVELYPGGMGLIDEISTGNKLLFSFFEACKNWLSSCHCDDACELCLETPSAIAQDIQRYLSRKNALEILNHYV